MHFQPTESQVHPVKANTKKSTRSKEEGAEEEECGQVPALSCSPGCEAALNAKHSTPSVGTKQHLYIKDKTMDG